MRRRLVLDRRILNLVFGTRARLIRLRMRPKLESCRSLRIGSPWYALIIVGRCLILIRASRGLVMVLGRCGGMRCRVMFVIVTLFGLSGRRVRRRICRLTCILVIGGLEMTLVILRTLNMLARMRWFVVIRFACVKIRLVNARVMRGFMVWRTRLRSGAVGRRRLASCH